jgi:tRNA A-37 threonylcarbamoyl transferase component Bud32
MNTGTGMRGAEAVLIPTRLIGRAALIKSRMAKGYRIRELDMRLRVERTRMEARLLHRAKLAGVPCPTVLEVSDHEITMERLKGRRPGMELSGCREAGRLLAKLHGADIIHGDYSPANLIVSKKGGSKGCQGCRATLHTRGATAPLVTVGSFYVIDFGLGFVSNDVEDKAVDVFTMLRALEKKGKQDAFVEGYGHYEKAKAVLKRVETVEKRVRYAF